MEQSKHTAINWMERQEIVSILENNGFACYDRESTDDLREALREGIEDNSISLDI